MKEYFQIELSKGKVTRVDEDFWDRFSHRRFSAHQKSKGAKFYARIGSISLHRFIVDAPKGLQVDHINGDTLDNRRENLRICTQAENNRNIGKLSTNTSGFKGVKKYYSRGKWNGSWCARLNEKHLGTRRTPEEAHKLYCDAVKIAHGEFARTE